MIFVLLGALSIVALLAARDEVDRAKARRREKESHQRLLKEISKHK